MKGADGVSHTCEHLLIAIKLPRSHPRSEDIPWDTDPILRALGRGIDTDVVVSEVRSVANSAISALADEQGDKQEARRGVRCH